MMLKRKKSIIFVNLFLLVALIIVSFAIRVYGEAILVNPGNFTLIGIVLFQGHATALIEDRFTAIQEFYQIGDTLGHYTIESITEKGVSLKSGEASIQLPTLIKSYDQSKDMLISMGPQKKTSENNVASSNAKEKKQLKGKKSQFIIPVKGRVTSRFGYRRHPMGGNKEFHSGIDIAAPHGKNVVAAASGRVIFAGRKGGYGKTVIIRHDRKYRTLYGHLSHISVKYRQKVTQGQIIGRTGSTGISTGPHLHFEIRRYNKPVDPFKYLPAK